MKEYRKLITFVRPYSGLLACAFMCMMLSAIFGGVSLGMIVPLVDKVFTKGRIILPGEVPSFISNLVDKLNALGQIEALKFILLVGLIVIFCKIIVFILQSLLMNMTGQRCVRDVRNKIYKKFQDLSLDFYGRKRTGELIARITSDAGIITNAISFGLTDLVHQSLQAVLFLVVVFYINWKLAFISFAIFPLLILPIVRLGKKIRKFSNESQDRVADLNSLLTETIQGAYIVKVFCREGHEFRRFKAINQQYYKFMMKVIKRDVIISPLTEFVGSVMGIIIMFIGAKDVIAGRLSAGVFFLFMASLLSMIKPFKKLSSVYAVTQRALAASGRIYDILEEEPSIKEKENALTLTTFSDAIAFEDVFFKYGKKDTFALKGIRLTIRKNDILALVGHSGAGKSTLVSLLPRLYEAQKGRVTIDGVDVRDIKIRSLRNLIAVVSQDMVIFNDTIKNNIAYGRDGATDNEIIAAAKKAHAFEFIECLADGFDTMVGDRGFRLSGGEKQRISIARAFLKDAPILILDEATSHLDSESERLIKEALDKLIEGKTVFVIAHRLSTVIHATKIIVLERGRIVEQGSHAQLLETSTVYKKLYQMQFQT